MGQPLLAIKKTIIKLAEWMLMLMLLAMTGVMFGQIIWRYLLEAPLVWSEELALLLMVWMTFLGSALMLERKEHVAIDVFVDLLPDGLKRLMQILGAIVILIFNCALTYGAFIIADTAWESLMPGLKISGSWQYIGVLLGGGLLTLVSLEALVHALRGTSKNEVAQ
ncbi:TRAP transporter small permease [Hoeflea alexandrii]|uniref:TRAP transporter small permease n=1 Tax=Hoeflea alexandrii TaxID=288436 RepID=UPI0022AFC51A|nr:TRAP transporter small permease [Hoeflea alexandrii]MCZ4289925.1 TRAP transporter small permease [Hoeflea alexandrii]